MHDFPARLAQIEDSEAILEYVFQQCRAEGATWFSYHFSPAFEAQTAKRAFIWAKDYPIEVQKAYIGGDYRSRDPIPRLTFEEGPILTWVEAEIAAEPSGEALAYLADLRRFGIDNWIAFALFGPHNRDGFAAMRFADDPAGFDESRKARIQALLQIAHLRLCRITDSKTSVSLSDREREVLRWMGRGKSALDIATILEISPETVRTYTRRIYDKLETNDRVTATVRALKLGLVEL